MMPAAKHLDPVLGVDIHLVQPPGPVPPVPIPHPFVGMLIDPLDYLPIVGATVKVNKLPCAVAGTAGVAMPPHIPIVGPFVIPPGNDCEMFMGSATVTFDGEPASHLSLPALSCHSPVGMISPPRMKKKTKMKSFVLPTSVVLPVPAGLPVNIGGPPTISMSGMVSGAISRGVLKGLGKGLKKLGRKARALQKASKRMKKVSERIHKAADALMEKLGVKSKRARQKVHKNICTVTGHPVDVATGKVFTDKVDFELPGPIPLSWERTYQSTSTYEGSLGFGWSHNYDLVAYEGDGVVVVRTEDGREVPLPTPDADAPSQNLDEKMELRRALHGLELLRDGMRYDLEPDLGTDLGVEDVVIYRLARIRDRAGYAVSFEYSQGALTRIIDSGGRELTVRSDSQDRITEIRGPHPDQPDASIALVSYVYDDRGDLIEVWDALNQGQSFEYRNHLMVRETDRNGLSFYFTYDGADASARCLRTWGDGGIYDHKLTYDDELGITVVDNSLGHKTTYHHDGALVHQEVDAYGNVTRTERDAHRQVVAEIDELERITAFAYDPRGNQTSIVGPDGAATAIAYGDNDRPVHAVDANGGEWQWTYDDDGQLTSRVDPTGAETKYDYRAHQLRTIVDPGGGETQLRWDVQGNLLELVDPIGARTQWTYDALGRVVAVTDPKGNVQRRTLDLLGRVTKVEEPNGNVRTFAYDGEGNVVRATDANSDVRFAYRGMGKMVSRTQAGATVRFEYDTEERLTAVVNEHKHRYRFELGPTGEVDAEIAFDGVTRRYVRDAAGQVVEVKRPEERWTKYTYDAAGRVTDVCHYDDTSERFEYRDDGELMAAINDDVEVRFERDPLGRVMKELVGDHWVESKYDPMGFRIGVISSMGLDQRIERNLVGDVTRVSAGDFDAQFERDIMGLEVERKLPGGVVARWERDRVGRPVKQEVVAGGALRLGREYTWDASDRLKQVKDAFHGTTRYEHDAWGNLSWAQFGDGTVQLRMPDEVGNLFKTEDRSDRTYGKAGQLLSAIEKDGVHTYSYDGEGNLIRKKGPDGIWEYRWNGAGMLKEVLRPDGEVVAFKYDVLARRVEKRFQDRVTRWVWDGDVPLHEWVEAAEVVAGAEGEVASQEELGRVREAALAARRAQAPPEAREGSREDPLTWLFEPESFTPMGKIGHGQAWSVVGDQIGTPLIGLRLRDGYMVSSLGPSRGAGSPWVEVGVVADPETNLHYNRYRYRDATSGVFCSRDPIGLFGGRRPYGLPGDPTTYADPLGLAKRKAKCGSLTGSELEEEVARKLDDAGVPYRANRKIGMHGSNTEIDFETDEAIIEVTRQRKGKLGQVTKHMNDPARNPGKKPVVLFAPDYQGTAAKDVEAAGGLVVRDGATLAEDLDTLVGLVK